MCLYSQQDVLVNENVCLLHNVPPYFFGMSEAGIGSLPVRIGSGHPLRKCRFT